MTYAQRVLTLPRAHLPAARSDCTGARPVQRGGVQHAVAHLETARNLSPMACSPPALSRMISGKHLAAE